MSGGAEANASGLAWEGWVKTVAQRQGFTIQHYSKRTNCNIPEKERRIIWIQAPYKTIFHVLKKPSKAYSEFVIECAGELVRVECKWQAGAGSVDEKYPFMYLNAVLTIEEPTVVFALGGAYFESGKGAEVKQWLIDACTNPPDWFAPAVHEKLKKRQLLVHTTNTFEKWFRQKFPKS